MNNESQNKELKRRRLKPIFADILLTLNMILFTVMVGFMDGPTETYGIVNVIGVIGCMIIIYLNHLVLKAFDGYYYIIEKGENTNENYRK